MIQGSVPDWRKDSAQAAALILTPADGVFVF
jgi:hypothetical protein